MLPLYSILFFSCFQNSDKCTSVLDGIALRPWECSDWQRVTFLFLQVKIIPYIHCNDDVGYVQARWTFTNPEESLLTKVMNSSPWFPERPPGISSCFNPTIRAFFNIFILEIHVDNQNSPARLLIIEFDWANVYIASNDGINGSILLVCV